MELVGGEAGQAVEQHHKYNTSPLDVASDPILSSPLDVASDPILFGFLCSVDTADNLL